MKKFESGIVRDPTTISSSSTVGDLIQLTKELNISGMPVVDDDNLVGIVTSRDFRNESNMTATVSSIMTPKEKLITAKENESIDNIKTLLYRNRIEKILLVDDAFGLKGLITLKDINKSKDYPSATKDSEEDFLLVQQSVMALIQRKELKNLFKPLSMFSLLIAPTDTHKAF